MEKGKKLLKDENTNMFWNFTIVRESDAVPFGNLAFSCKLFCNGFISKTSKLNLASPDRSSCHPSHVSDTVDYI